MAKGANHLIGSHVTKCTHQFGWPDCKPVPVPLAGRQSFISDPPLLTGSSSLPGSRARRAAASSPIWPCSAWGLPCHTGYPMRGALLPHHFTLTCRSRRNSRRYIFCGTFRKVRFERTPPAVSRHAALWRPDFPRSAAPVPLERANTDRDCPSGHPFHSRTVLGYNLKQV